MSDFNYRVERRVVSKELFTKRADGPESAISKIILDTENGGSGASEFVEYGEWVAIPLCPVCSSDMVKESDDWHVCTASADYCGYSEFDESVKAFPDLV